MPELPPSAFIGLFYEAGIITQISTAFLEARLPDGLLASHFGVVSHLIRVQDGATPVDLARAFQVPKTTMTHTLSGLEARGLVEMRPNPRDKRSKQVFLTAAGRDFVAAAFENLAPLIKELGQRFDEDRIAALLPELAEFRKMIDALRDEIN